VPEEEHHDESWREFLEDETDESAPADSGDDSDEGSAAVHGDRHKNDMELLMKMQAKSTPKERKTSPTSPTKGEDADAEPQERPEAIEGNTQEAEEAHGTTGGYQMQHKKGLMSRLFGSKQKSVVEIPPGTSMLGQDLSKREDKWYEEHLARLGKDGIRCTKVGTNGKPYERFVYLDSRNLTLEIRGGRSGTSGVMMDDLVDIRQGLSSPDFQQLGLLNPEQVAMLTS